MGHAANKLGKASGLRRMKVALVSTGLGRVLRGFESFAESLFVSLRSQVPQLDVVLFQGGGRRGERRVVVPNLHRQDAPARWFGDYRGNQLEKRSFALCLYPYLRRGGFDVVHYNELVMGSALFHLRNALGGTYKLLYCDGAPCMPQHYIHRCDFAQVLTNPAYQQARQVGMADERLFLIPYGVNASTFTPATGNRRFETRKHLRIPEGAKVVLSVAALDRLHKRIDHLIREIGALEDRVWLLAAGQRTEDTSSLEAMAEELLPGRWRFVSWPHDRLPLLYGAADAFVLASLEEGFGLVTVEAMLSGLPVVVHNAPVFRWVAGESSVRCIDMAASGALTRELASVLDDSGGCSAREAAVQRFAWKSLIPSYLTMYRQASGLCRGAGDRIPLLQGDLHDC
jgi:glycosyltransferase involved in cell wall biosynthesis